MNDDRERYYGKYRGIVLNSVDPGFKGRLTANVNVCGAELQVVAEASTPYPGFYAIPPEGSGVWIEFEEGDLDKPIWTGCWWREGEPAALLSPDVPPPTAATAPKTVVLSVAAAGFPAAIPMARLKLDTTKGTATIESLAPPASPATPTSVKLGPEGIEISYGVHKIRITTVGGVDVNNGALTIV
jgi:hypothetical protein